MNRISQFLRRNRYLLNILLLLVITNEVIILNIPILRQIFGLIFLSILPGTLLIQVLKIEKASYLNNLILAHGLTISFLLLFGLFLNNLASIIHHETPLSTPSLLISLNIVYILLAIFGHMQNCRPVLPLIIKLSSLEKSFLIIPFLFPAISIIGTHVMNITGNNKIIMFMIFLISFYVTFICYLSDKFPKRIYPVVIYLIGISILLIYSFRSNHIIGVDSHSEYYIFRITSSNMYWHIIDNSLLDSTLSISILPTIYSHILNVNPEFLFRILYSLLFSAFPLVVYAISKKYIGEYYSFIATIFVMFQKLFLISAANSRTSIAILFVSLTIFVIFNGSFNAVRKSLLFILFSMSAVLSHYSTTYVFFFILVGTYIGTKILSYKYVVDNFINLSKLILLFIIIFFWYSQITETPFEIGTHYLITTFSNLNDMFILDSRGGGIPAVIGSGIGDKAIPHKIEFIFTWLTFALIGTGIFSLFKNYRQITPIEPNIMKLDILTAKIEIEYCIAALVCTGLLFATIALPHISIGYGIDRLYGITTIILSTFFVLGGRTLSNYLKTKPWVIMIIVIIPYFFCITGVTYNIFDIPRDIILNSKGEAYDAYYIHDQESCSAKWLVNFGQQNTRIYADLYGRNRLISQGLILPSKVSDQWLENPFYLNGYVYLSYSNIFKCQLVDINSKKYNLTDYEYLIYNKNNIYNNSGSKIFL